MQHKRFKVLVLEDNSADFRLLEEALKTDVVSEFDLVNVSSLEDGLKRLSGGKIDIVIMEFFLQEGRDLESKGLEILEKLKEAAPQTPIIVLTGVYTDWLAVQVRQFGAACFMQKEWMNVRTLAQTLRYYAGVSLVG